MHAYLEPLYPTYYGECYKYSSRTPPHGADNVALKYYIVFLGRGLAVRQLYFMGDHFGEK